MIYAGIDVNIITHEKAEAAGIEAFGLWAWAMCWAQVHASDGRIPRLVVLRALGGKRNVMLAKRLVDAGLWLLNDDGSWTIWNYAEKNQTAEEIQRKRDAAKRRKDEWKARQAAERNANGTRSGDATERVPERPYTTPPSLPSPPSLPERESEPPLTVLTERLRDEARAQIEPTPETVDIDHEWKKYVADRETKGRPLSSPDWRSWILKAIGFAKTERMRQSDRDRAADERRRFAKEGPERPPPPTKEQSQAFADELARRVLADRNRKVGT